MRSELKGRDWPAIFNNYERSGLNQLKFCEREGLKFIEFKYQRTKYLKQQSKISGFAPIQVKSSSSDVVEMTLPHGIGLKFREGTSIEYVKRLLSILR